MLSSSSEEAADAAQPSAIRVLVRVRPLNDKESSKISVLQLHSSGGASRAIDFGINVNNNSSSNESSNNDTNATTVGSSGAGEGTVSIIDCGQQQQQQQQQHSFTYDAVFGPESQQRDVFESVKGIVDAVVGGYNGTIVAYGQTGSGKTHTIFGGEEPGEEDINESAGLVQRSIKAIFDKMNSYSYSNSSNNAHATSSSHFKAKASFFEIYNEKVYDLLSSNDSMLQESLAVREDATTARGVYVEGLLECDVANTVDAMNVLRVGNNNRRVAATSMNRVSSRSHAVFVLTVKQNILIDNYDDHDGDGRATTKALESKFTLVDLAGSERQKATDAAGERLKEASMINTSLLCLGQVINSLVDKEKGKERHVPFRDSKLTFLLRDSWGGNSKTLLVATVTPSVISISETISTLKFAQRAKLIKNTAIKNETYSVEALQMEIVRLKRELEEQKKRNYTGSSSNNNDDNNAIIAAVLSSTSSGGAIRSNNCSNIDRITISSLRNHNSKLKYDLKVLKDSSELMEMQVDSLKKKLQQEIMIRKCKERRITFLLCSSKSTSLSSSSNDGGVRAVDNEEMVATLQNEVNVLREQLESKKQNPELIKYMIKYKEEKMKLEQIQNSNAAALYEANDKAELEAHLDSLLNDKDALEQQLASLQSGRNDKMKSMERDVARLEKVVDDLKSHLLKRETDVLHLEAEVKGTKSQIGSLDKDRIEALELLETVNSELVAEKKRVVHLQASIDSMKQVIQENDNKAKEQETKEAAQLNELTDTKTQLQNLQKILDATKEENCSLIKKLNDAMMNLSTKETEIAQLKSENEQALASFNLMHEEGRDELESFQTQLKDKEDLMTSLLHEKTELQERVDSITAQNSSLFAEIEVLKKRSVDWQERVDSLEDEVMCISHEKSRLEEELSFVQEDLKRSVAFQEESNAKMAEAHDSNLAQRDEVISLLRSEKQSLVEKFDAADSACQEHVEILKNEIKATKKECEAFEKKEQNLLSTLEALTISYNQLREENDVVEKELKETKMILKNSTSTNEELERISETKDSEIEEVKAECDALKKKEYQLHSELEIASKVSSQLQSEKVSLGEELVAIKTRLQDCASTNAELESSNKSKAVEIETLKGENEAVKEKEQQLLSELKILKSNSAQLQSDKEATGKELAETKALLASFVLANEELERTFAAKSSDMETSMKELEERALRLSEEKEASIVLFETQVSKLTEENRSLQASIGLSERESENNAVKLKETEAVLAGLKGKHAADIEKLKQELLEKTKMEAAFASLKVQHAEEIERLLNEAEALKNDASTQEESIAAKLKDMDELVKNLKHQHAVEIERLQSEAEVAENEAFNNEAAATKKLTEIEAVLTSLKDQHAAEIHDLKRNAETAMVDMMEKAETCSEKMKEMKDLIEKMKVQHAEEMKEVRKEVEDLKAEAFVESMTPERDIMEDIVKETTFDDEDDDFDESMFLPNVDVRPDASEMNLNASSLSDASASSRTPPVVDAVVPTEAPASTVSDALVTSPVVVAEPLSTSTTSFNEANQNAGGENPKPSPTKPATRRSKRNDATKIDQTPVQRVTRRSTRTRTPFSDLQPQDTK